MRAEIRATGDGGSSSRAYDLTGQIFGRLTAIEQVDSTHAGAIWRCQCSCSSDSFINVAAGQLRAGYKKSCGCLPPHQFEDLTGQKFNLLTVLGVAGKINGKLHWLCECECGEKKKVRTLHLRNGRIKSCGHLAREEASARLKDPNHPARQHSTFKDITGQRFGKLKVIEVAGLKNGQYQWLCECDCGSQTVVLGGSLRSGGTKSCGCSWTENGITRRGVPRPELQGPRTDVTGQRFGRLLALECTGEKQFNTYRWRCECDCGNIVEIVVSALTGEHTRSCGCLLEDTRGESSRTHGMSGSPEHLIWQSMRRRCRNRNDQGYKDYGARGIVVCGRWDSFEAFFEDMGWRPGDEYSIDRIDNDKGYECGRCDDCKSCGTKKLNCRWATIWEQSRNKRNNIFLTHNGQTLCLTDWAKEIGMRTSQLWHRLYYCGWPVDLALDTPVGVKPPDLNERRLPVDPKVKQMFRAYDQVRQAIRRGEIIKPPHCVVSGCETGRVEAHHWIGYDHPLDVIFLCKQHHEMVDHGQLEIADLPKHSPKTPKLIPVQPFLPGLESDALVAKKRRR